MDDNALAWCRRLVACRSVSNDGTRAIMEMCAREFLAPLGITAELLPSSNDREQVNLFAFIAGREAGSAPIVLNTHLDTVPPGDYSLWTECSGDPFNPTLKAGRIYGLGAADTKLDFAAKVLALAAGRPRRDVCLIATFGEERGLLGAREMAASGRLPRGALAYIGEASHLQVITAHKGLMAFELVVGFEPVHFRTQPLSRAVFSGRAAHSSTPRLGKNAIRDALEKWAANPAVPVLAINGGDAVNKVPARCELIIGGATPGFEGAAIEPLETTVSYRIPQDAMTAVARFVARLEQFADDNGPVEPDYAAPTLTCNAGVISSGEVSITLEFEMRPPPTLALQTVREGLSDMIERFKADFSGLTFIITEKRANPGFRSRLDGPTVELAMAALAKSGLPLDHGVKAGCTEAGVYADAGLEPIVFGPGPSTGVIHAPNEHNFVADVDGAIRFYTELLQL
jgi:acetylornithine deacetylase/succinyl-diaminopimelate desuccinylase-like protein